MKIKSNIFYSGIILILIILGTSSMSYIFQTQNFDLYDSLGLYYGLIGLLSLGIFKMMIFRRKMETLHFSYKQRFSSFEILGGLLVFNILCLLGIFKMIGMHEIYGLVILMLMNVLILYRLSLPCGISQNNLYLLKKYDFKDIESYHFEKNELDIVFTKQKFNLSLYDEVKLDIPLEQHDLIEKKYLKRS